MHPADLPEAHDYSAAIEDHEPHVKTTTTKKTRTDVEGSQHLTDATSGKFTSEIAAIQLELLNKLRWFFSNMMKQFTKCIPVCLQSDWP